MSAPAAEVRPAKGDATPLLEARAVTVRFGGVVALDAVDFRAAAGVISGLVGPNGAGKTTLFGILSGLLRARSGRVLLDGVDVTRASPQRRARLGVARTFQRLELFGELTVRQHLVVAHRVRHKRDRSLARDLVGLGNRPSPDENEAVEAIIDLLALGDVVDRPVTLLPLGTGRVVEIARALATAPRIVLLDEPTSGLDVHETERVASALRAARDQRGIAFVMVEHDVELVLELSDAVTVLDFGQVIAEGPPSSIRGNPAVQAAYLGDPIDEDAR
jgi:ABC-type branched-subunit amino acid transport system ATPase component